MAVTRVAGSNTLRTAKKKKEETTSQIQQWIVLPDCHIPYHDEKSLRAVEAFVQSRKFDGWICLGDSRMITGGLYLV
jgi:hypothetical protein